MNPRVTVVEKYRLLSPITYSWEQLANLSDRLVSKVDYEEMGSDYLDVRCA